MRVNLFILFLLNCYAKAISRASPKFLKGSHSLSNIINWVSWQIATTAFSAASNAFSIANTQGWENLSKPWRRGVSMSICNMSEGSTNFNKSSSNTGELKNWISWCYLVLHQKLLLMEALSRDHFWPLTLICLTSWEWPPFLNQWQSQRKVNFIMKAIGKIHALSLFERTLRMPSECL